MGRPHPLSADELMPLKTMHAEVALKLLWAHVVADQTRNPARDPDGKHLVATTRAGVFHLVVTGPKWFDVDAQRGGHGAIDLGLHVTGRPFLPVARLLLKALQSRDTGSVLPLPSEPRRRPRLPSQPRSARE